MTLMEYIQQSNLNSASDILANLERVVEINRDSTNYSLSGLADQLSKQVDPTILVSLRSHIRTLPIGGDTLEGLLLSGGVDFSLDAIRLQINANQQNSSTTPEQQAILSGMLSIGIQYGSQWQAIGLSELPTESQINAEIQAMSAIPSLNYDQKVLLLTVNAAPDGIKLSMIKKAVAVVDNKVIDEENITSVGTADARSLNLKSDDQNFIDSLLALIDGYLGGN